MELEEDAHGPGEAKMEQRTNSLTFTEMTEIPLNHN